MLRQHNPRVKIIAVEPSESAVLSGGQAGAHRIEGIGIGFAPPLWDSRVVDEIVPIPTADAQAMARRLAREEGLFAGTSSGGNVVAAIRIGERFAVKIYSSSRHSCQCLKCWIIFSVGFGTASASRAESFPGGAPRCADAGAAGPCSGPGGQGPR